MGSAGSSHQSHPANYRNTASRSQNEANTTQGSPYPKQGYSPVGPYPAADTVPIIPRPSDVASSPVELADMTDYMPAYNGLNQGRPPPIGFAPHITQGQVNSGYPAQGSSSGQQGYPLQQGNPPQQGTSSQENPSQREPIQNVNPAEWDDKRSLILTRVLSADEFLGRMDETDEKTVTLSALEPEERVRFSGRIEELLGLRGHLQDELLRIQEMLAEDDPELECLNEYNQDFPRVVKKMHDLRRSATLIPSVEIQTVDIQTDDGGSGIAIETTDNSFYGPMWSEMSTQDQDSYGNNMNTNSDESFRPNGVLPSRTSFALQNRTGKDIKEFEKTVEEDLKKKHDREEKEVAQNYAKQVTSNPGRITQDEMNKLLNEHAISMQALRKKQEAEKNKLKEILEAKKRERLLKRRSNKHGEEDSETEESNNSTDSPGFRKGTACKKIGVVTPIMANSPQTERDNIKDRSGSGSKNSRDSGLGVEGQTEADNESDNSDVNDSEDDLESLMSFNKREDHYSDDFEDDDSEEEHNEAKNLKALQGDLWSMVKSNPNATAEDLKAVLEAFRAQEGSRKQISDAERGKLQESLAAKLAARKARETQGRKMDADDNFKSVGDSGVGEGTDFDKVDKEIAKKDEEFAKKMKEKRRYLTDQEYAEFLKQHLAEVEELRRKRQSEKNHLDAKLKDKLCGKRKQGSPEQTSSEEDGCLEDEETQNDLRRMEQELLRKVTKSSKTMSEEDLLALLKKHRREQAELIRQRNAQRTITDDKIKQKLQERKKLRDRTQHDTKMSHLDDEFFKNLQAMQKSGRITEDVFASMLESYLKQVETVKDKRRSKKRPQDLSVAREAASNMVKEVEENAKQINDLRKREKDKIDERLKKKLNAKKNKKQAASVEG